MSNAIFREQRFVGSEAPPTVVAPVLATLSGLTTATTSVAHTSTVTLNSPADQTYTITWSRSNSGTGSATSTITAGNTVATTTSTWAAEGAGRTVGFSISPSITKSGDPLTIIVSDPVATTVTLSGGTTSGTTNSPMTVTVTLNGAVPPGGFTATLGRSGVAGSLGTSSLVFTFGGPKTLSTTNTNTADGASSVTMTSGGLTPIGTPQSYTSSTAIAAPTGLITQYLTSDGGSATYSGNFSGPTRDYWHRRLGFAWKRTNTLGNWLDASQAEEGGTAYASSAAITSVGQVVTITATTLVARWMSTGQNRGAYLRINSGSAFPVAFYGRTDATAANRPTLTIVTSTSTFVLTAAANAYFYNSSFTGNGSAPEWRLSSGAAVAVLRFDLSTVTGSITSATLSFKVKSFPSGGSTGQVIGLYECDPPTIVVPENLVSPVLGLADTYDDFNAWKTSGNAALITADDFELGGPFDGGFTPAATRTFNPATGTTYARGEITTGSNGSANSRLEVSSGTGTQGIPNIVREEVYGQYWLYLESDFGTTQDDAIKIPAMGVQFGYWVPTGSGYWQQTTGNGGYAGTGLKVDRGGGLNYEYQGHSIRFLTGTRKTALDDDPYDGWFGISIYDYNLDQGGPFPAGASFPMIAIRPNRQYCIDIRVKQNTMTGAQDALGNYATANADGIYEVWINGYPAYSRTNYRWRKHAEFGVQGMWIDVYHGGTSTQSAPGSHYQVDRVSLATSYIGPKISIPEWVPSPGAATTLTNTNGRLSNNYRSVVNDYYDAFYAVKSVGGFNGGFVNPYWGDYGALLFWGGGHSDTNHNGMIALELTAAGGTYKRLADASDYYGATALSGAARTNAIGLNGIGYVVVDGKASGRNTATGIVSGNEYSESRVGDGAPNAPHSWGSGDVISPTDGGASYGSFLQVLSQANTREENYSVYAAHKLNFADLSHGLGARSWVRVSNNWQQGFLPGDAPMHSIHVPAHGRVYTFGRAATRRITWYDIAAGTYSIGTGEGFTLDQASAPGGNGGGAIFHVPERDILVCCYGWPNLVVQWINVASGVTQPTRISGGGGTATLSASVSVETLFGSACWCPDNSRIIVGGLAAADTIAEIAIPTTLTDTWTVETTTTTAGVLPSPLTGTNNPQIFKRWSYNPRVKSIVLQRFATLSGDDTVYVYRPRNT